MCLCWSQISWKRDRVYCGAVACRHVHAAYPAARLVEDALRVICLQHLLLMHHMDMCMRSHGFSCHLCQHAMVHTSTGAVLLKLAVCDAAALKQDSGSV
jgi:hypothetical protein